MKTACLGGPVTHSYRSCNGTCLTCDAHRWERLPTYASPARRLGGRGPMRLRQWLASGCVMAVAAGLTACGGSSGGGGGGGGGVPPSAPAPPAGGDRPPALNPPPARRCVPP